MKYNTHRKQELLALFSNNPDKAFRVDDILSLLEDMSQSTLYRLVSSLYEEGFLRKIDSDDRATHYQYCDREHCSQHLHIKCKSCGQVEHLDEKTSAKIIKLVSSESGFSTLNSSMLEGVCSSCKESE